MPLCATTAWRKTRKINDLARRRFRIKHPRRSSSRYRPRPLFCVHPRDATARPKHPRAYRTATGRKFHRWVLRPGAANGHPRPRTTVVTLARSEISSRMEGGEFRKKIRTTSKQQDKKCIL